MSQCHANCPQSIHGWIQWEVFVGSDCGSAEDLFRVGHQELWWGPGIGLESTTPLRP